MNPVEEYIASKDPQLRELMDMLRHIILSTSPEFREKIAYGIPFFYIRKNICYLNPTNEGLDVGFVRGSAIGMQHKSFELKGRKTVKSFRFKKLEDIDFELFDQVLQEAIRLDKK